MATTFEPTTWTSIGNQLTTELNSLGIGGISAFSAAWDNTTTLYLWVAAIINLASLTPTAGAYLQLLMTESVDGGTTYEDAPSSTNPGWHMAQPSVAINVSTSAKVIRVPPIRVFGGKFKCALLNGAGVALAATGNTLALYGSNDQGV